MGKGIIKSGGTAGLYTIDISRDTTAMDARKVKLEQRLLDIADEITAADAEVAATKFELDSALAEMDALIDLWTEFQDNDDEINLQAGLVAHLGKEYRIEKQKRDALVLDQVSIQKQIEAIESVDTLIEAAAWCADYTEDLTGDVGTVEIPGDRTRVLVRPGYNNEAVYISIRDGQLQPTQSSTAAAVAWNYAMFPGWQKWIPQYRSATITAIDTDANTCTITFGAETSTAQGLDVNYITASSDIPIQYMTCDHEAFAINDIVLVEFEIVTEKGTVDNWANPKVIGFIDNPKECPVLFGYRVQPNPGCETADNEECWNGWGAPFDDGGDPPTLINPPWGTAESGSQTQSLLVKQGGWKHWRDPQTQTWSSTSGTIDWQGNGMLCGWFGGNQGSRYRIHDQAYWVAYEGRSIATGNAVTGACVREFDNKKILIVASDDNNETKVSTYNADTGTLEWTSSFEEGTYDLSGFLNTGSFWLFNAAGTTAIQIREYSGPEPDHSPCHMTSPVWRRKMQLSVSLRVGGGGIIVPDISVTDLGDEMPVFVEPTENYTFYTASLGTVGTMNECLGGDITPVNITGLLENEYWERDNSLSFSYKFYDYVGNVEASAEFWNTRDWVATHSESPAPVNILADYYECPGGYGNYADVRTGTNHSTFVTQEFPVACSGSAVNKCGVRFSGSSISDLEWEANDSYTGTGTSASGIQPESGYETRPSFGNTRNTSTTSSFTRLSLAVPYMDMRFGQLITVVEMRTTNITDSHSFDYAEPVQNEFWDYTSAITTTLTISVYANGAKVDSEEREGLIETTSQGPYAHYFDPYQDLSQNIHRKCRGEHGTAIRPDYLFQGPLKDPRPMASAGGTSYCYSYVDRWVKDDEADPSNENVPPIRSVMSKYPVALGIPGPFPNAAPVTPVEPSI